MSTIKQLEIHSLPDGSPGIVIPPNFRAELSRLSEKEQIQRLRIIINDAMNMLKITLNSLDAGTVSLQ